MRYIISLDLSSVTVGYVVFNEKKEIVELNYFKYDVSDDNDLLDKGKQLDKFFKELFKKYPETEAIIIEERLKKFAGGKSSINNVLVLAQINYISQYLLRYIFNIKVIEINVLKARGLVFPSIFKETRLSKEKQKDYVFRKVKDIIGESYFKTKIVSRGKNKGNVEYLEENKDMTDAYLIGLAYFKKMVLI